MNRQVNIQTLCVLIAVTLTILAVAPRIARSLIVDAKAAELDYTSSLCGFNPDYQVNLSYKDSETTLRLQKVGEKLTIISSPPEGMLKKTILPSEIAQVNELRRASGDKAVVIGMVNGSAYEVVVLNISAMTISDQFLAYHPTISPDGRFIAFVKFYPSHFVQGVTDKYMVYDLNDDAAGNRPHGIKATDQFNVGLPIYPVGSSNQDGDNSGFEESAVHRMTSDRFSWSQDSNTFVFPDLSDNTMKIIKAQINSRKDVSISTLVVPKAIRCTPVCLDSVAGLSFIPGALLADLHGIGASASLEALVKLDEDQFAGVPNH